MDAIKTKRMKSIKEKSEEHAPYTREDSWEKTQRCIIAQTSFEAGANYVLGEVEKIFSKANKYKDGSDHTILYLDIEFLIKQLKE